MGFPQKTKNHWHLPTEGGSITFFQTWFSYLVSLAIISTQGMIHGFNSVCEYVNIYIYLYNNNNNNNYSKGDQ